MKIIIKTEELRNRALTVIHGLSLDPVQQVEIKPYKRNRSLEQNRYYWKIVTIMAAELGNTKDELHHDMKRRFLTRIFVRDDPGYADMASAIQSVKKDDPGLAGEIGHKVIDLTSTTQANVSQMSEYLDDVKHLAAELGIRLPAEEEA